MATTTIRLGLILILSLTIIQISKAKSETEDQNEIDQESEASMMVSSSEEAKIRNVREAGKNGNKLDRKEKNAQKKKKKKKGEKASRKAGQRKNKVGRRQRKKGGKAGKGGKKPRNGADRKRPRKGKKRNNNKRKSEKELKKKKKKRRQNKNGKRQKKITKKFRKPKKPTGIARQGTCDEAKLCQKIKDYIKYSNQLRKVRRIVKSCDTMDKKATKAATEFSATVAALDQVISGNAKRQLYIRWRRTKRSTDEVVAIRDNLKNCSASAKAKCEKSVEPACAESAIHTECDAALEAWLKSFGPSKGSCLQASADCCACITALPEVDAKCLDFEAKSKAAVASKKKCTGGTETGSFGFCRKQQQDASVKGPKAACGGSTATKAPGASTTKAGTGASTAAQDSEKAEQMGEKMEKAYEDCLDVHNHLNESVFREKIKYHGHHHGLFYGNLSTDVLKGDPHITNKISILWEILKNNKTQSEVDEELDNLKLKEQNALCFYVIESARTVSKIVKTETNGLNGLYRLWNAAIANTEKDNTTCNICNDLDLQYYFYQNVTLGTVAGCKQKLGFTDCYNGSMVGLEIAIRGFVHHMRNPHNHSHPFCSDLVSFCCCFSGIGQVETTSGPKEISELIIGDFVKTSSGENTTHFTEFLGWLGRDKSATFEMLKVFTCKGCPSLTLSGNHIVFTPNSTKYADQLQPGDFMVYFNGSDILNEMVTEIQKTFAIGSFSPLTRDGTLLVDGYLASCYASFPHWVTDLALAPVKAMSTILLDNEDSQHKDGSRSVTKFLKGIGNWSGFRQRNLNKIEEISSSSIDQRTQLNSPIIKSEF